MPPENVTNLLGQKYTVTVIFCWKVVLLAIYKLLVVLWQNFFNHVFYVKNQLRVYLNALASWHWLVSSAKSTCSQWGSVQDFEKAIPTLILARFSHSFTTFDVCLGSLSCLNPQLRPRPNLLADDYRFLLKNFELILLLHCSIYFI